MSKQEPRSRVPAFFVGLVLGLGIGWATAVKCPPAPVPATPPAPSAPKVEAAKPAAPAMHTPADVAHAGSTGP